MTQEDKELLLKDLSGRIPYGLRLKIGDYSDYKLIGIVITDEHPIKLEVIENGTPYKIEVSSDIIKPYLRPMSSMTEEEYKELKSISSYYGFAPYEFIGDWCPNYEMTDWLNAHHFDYRNLIERGLAIEVTEENNPYEN